MTSTNCEDEEFATVGWTSLFEGKRTPTEAGFRPNVDGSVGLSKLERLIAAGEMVGFAANLRRLSTFFAVLTQSGSLGQADRHAFFSRDAREERLNLGTDVHSPARAALQIALRSCGPIGEEGSRGLAGQLLMLESLIALERVYLASVPACGANPQVRRPRTRRDAGAAAEAAVVAHAVSVRAARGSSMTWAEAIQEGFARHGRGTLTPHRRQELCTRARQASSRGSSKRRAATASGGTAGLSPPVA